MTTAWAADDAALEHVLVVDHIPAQRDSITDVNLESYSGFARLIDRSTFEHKFTDFAILLDQLPGVQVNQSGGLGAYNAVSVRGSTGKQVNIFLDGLLLNSPSSGTTNINAIPAILIERIEAYPDFTPAQLGNANLAGAINFKTRDINAEESGGHLQLAYGSFQTSHSELSGWSNLADWQFIGGASSTRSQNNYPVDKNLFRTSSKNRQNDGYAQDSAFIKTGRTWQHQRLSALLQYSDSTKDLATSLNQQRDNAQVDNISWRIQALLDHTRGAISFGHRFFASREVDLYQDPNSTIGLSQDKIESESIGVGIFNVANYCTDYHELVASLELRQDDIEQSDLLAQKKLATATRDTAIIALSDSWDITPSWRLGTIYRHYLISDSVAMNNQQTDSSADISEPSLQIGSRWQINSALAFKSNIGQLLRIPSLSEKFGARGLYEGSPDLRHEQALTLEAGLEWKFATFSGSTTSYLRQVDDGIVTIFDSRGVGKPQNIAQSQLSGFEFDINWTPLAGVDISANSTLLDSENQSNIAGARGQKLPGVYHQSHGVAVVLYNEQTRFSLRYQYHNELYYNAANSVEADAKNELSASISHKWHRYTVDLSARNLRDENFLDLNRFPTPGRSFMTTLSIDI
ncbi:MAG: iron complex outermembrane receptor protein [Zhongshania sp.]|jgi:iron complex outermembrane receptor protein